MKIIFKLSNIGKVIALIFLFTSISIVLLNNIFATTVASASESITISKIDDISATLIKGYTYELPSTVTAVMSDGSTKQVPIVWQASSSNTTTSDKYIFYGTVQGYSRTVIATVYKKYIQSIADISVTVNQEDNYTLPSKVTAVLNDNSTEQLGVIWNPASANTNTVGKFIFQGTVKGYDKKVNLTLTVQKYIKSIADISKTVNQGDDFTLPSEVTAVMSDNTNQQIAVTWNPSSVDTSKPGNFTFQGTVKGYDKKVILTLNVLERGNTTGNILNGGFITQKGDWIYYARGGAYNYRPLYKVKIDGTGKTELSSDNVMYINVVGDWIYYKGNGYQIYKVKNDGTGRTKLNDDDSYYINVIGDWIYYENGDDGSLYKIKTDGTERTKLNDYRNYFSNVVGDWIYYSNGADGSLYKIKTDSTGTTKLNDDYSQNINVAGDWIYYLNGSDSKLYKIKTDGTERTKLSDEYIGGEYITINVVGDWIYYLNTLDRSGGLSYTYSLRKIKTDGTGKQIVN